MLALRRSVALPFILALALLPGLAAWPSAPPAASALAAGPRLAYVYDTDTVAAASFKIMLELRGFTVDLVTLSAAETFDFGPDQAILIGDDTGGLGPGPHYRWFGSAQAQRHIFSFEKYTIGIGQGGALYFQSRGLTIGWDGSSNASIVSLSGAQTVNPGAVLWSSLHALPIAADSTVSLYTQPVATLAILGSALGPNTTTIGRWTDQQGLDSYPLVAERVQGQQPQCNLLWGFRGAPSAMSPAGQDLFENIVQTNPCAARVAYVANNDSASANSFAALLAERGVDTDIVMLDTAESFDFSNDLAIILGSDTGAQGTWIGSALLADHLNSAGKPIVGVGEGGATFFGLLSLAIGYANSWRIPSATPSSPNVTVANGAQALYSSPYPIAAATGDALPLYNGSVNILEINIPGATPSGVALIGRGVFVPPGQPPSPHYSLISQRGAQGECYALWGFDGAPSAGVGMTTVGKNLFVNMVLGKPCGEAPSASADLSIKKTSAPAPATVGASLTYKLTVSNAGPSTATAVKVADTLPPGLALISVTPSQGTCSFAAVVSCQLGSLAAGGAVASVALVVKPSAAGTLSNSASVSSPVSDPNSANNSASLDTIVNPAPKVSPVLALPYRQFVNIPIQAFGQNDLSIAGIEITQGVQCFDSSKGLASCQNNSLPVVTKKDTTARIYLKCSSAIAASCTKSNVPVRLHMIANGVDYTANANGKATPSIDQAVHDAAEIYFNVNFSSSVVVSFYAEVDPSNAISESNETNNRFPASGTFSMTFDNRTTMTIVGQRLRYHPAGYSGAQYAGGTAVDGMAASWFAQVLPIRNNGISYSVASGYKDWTTSLGSSDGQHALIQSLNTQWLLQNAFAWLFGASSYTGAQHVYGWAPSAGYSGGHADMPIYPHAGGLGVVGIGSDAAGSSTDSPGAGTLIFGHELTHDYNVKHTNTSDSCGSSDDTSDFPYASSSIQEFGFNPVTGKIYDPSNTHDLMSYCPSGGSKQGWISPFTWNRMFAKLSPSQLAAAAPTAAYSSTLVINATIANPAMGVATGLLGELHKVDTAVPLTPPAPGAYSIELRKGATVLASQSFDASFASEYGAGNPLLRFNTAGTPTPNATVSFMMPWADGATSIVLLHGATVLDTRAVSAGAPSVLITSPSAPVGWTAGTTQTLSWAGADPEGDALHYSVFYSNDGSKWELLESGLTATSLVLNVDSLAGGANVRFRVVATDGINIGFDETDAPISVPDKLPVALISDPGAGGKLVAPGDLLVATGLGADLEDGNLPDEALSWSSNRQGLLAIGPTLATNALQAGLHTITLTVHDSDGQVASASMQIFVGTRVALPLAQK